jgi:hypothetical protein
MSSIRIGMCLIWLAVAATADAQTTAGQPSATTSPETTGSTTQDTVPPVSLDHIRKGLNRPAQELLLRQAEIPADFRVQILEQQRIDDLLSKLDFKGASGPVPAGGIYAYEQQRRLFDPVNHPLMQPYAAYSPGEFMTVALENLIGRYLAPKIANAFDARGTHEAQAEVDQAIAEYCASRPDRATITLCEKR